ncbi:Hypothetical predicted protein [Cloeon dipterum]|uniref:Cytochrome P450 n=3 Tax=Cloeon dipterum TaxID=197152 RepID=A0A8S1DCI5_9INSE|nr:Hypothetical predicted protein [Cloeon dipterum]
MAWSLPLWLNVLLSLSAVFLGLFYYYLTYNFDYWKKKGVKHEKGWPLFGSLFSAMTLREHRVHCLDKIYKKYSGESFVGYYQGRDPALLILDPELIKRILVKDFSYFTSHGIEFNEKSNPMLAKNLFSLEGQRWRDMRSKIAPAFTTGKMKIMVPYMAEVGQNWLKFLSKNISDEAVDLKELAVTYTADAIGTCVFGVNYNAFENPNNTFMTMGRRLVGYDFKRGIKAICVIFFPEVVKFFDFEWFERSMVDFFCNLLKEMMDSRKKTGQTRKDFLQLMVELKEKGSVTSDNAEDEKESKKLSGFEDSQPTQGKFDFSDVDIYAQAFAFFVAGFENSSTQISLACLELAVESELQHRAHAEIDQVLKEHDGKLTAESLKKMVYLESIVQETLRKYPPAGGLVRSCTKNYLIPGTNVRIEKGTIVMIPTYSLQNDPKYFPDPERFDPERFCDEDAHHKLQYLYTPFGDGPRHCIGMRFSQLLIKTGLASILSKFEILPCKETVYPPKIDPIRMPLSSVGGVQVKMQERKVD